MRLMAESISHRFPGHKSSVLTDVSLVAGAGRMIAVTGPSGSGKSTLLSVLGLILRPDHGAIQWGDQVLGWGTTAARARASLFGWVTQTSNVFGNRTVADNVAVALLSSGYSLGAARRAAVPALALVGLAHRRSAVASVLSGGELQRMTVARVIVAAKPVILADEPTGQLDRANTDLVIHTLREAANQGAAVVVATHDLRVAQSCDDQLDLVDGRAS